MRRWKGEAPAAHEKNGARHRTPPFRITADDAGALLDSPAAMKRAGHVTDRSGDHPCCLRLGTRAARYSDDPDFRKAVSGAVDPVSKGLSAPEKVRRTILADEAFTVENDQMKPSMKLRRHVLRKVYGERLDALYRH